MSLFQSDVHMKKLNVNQDGTILFLIRSLVIFVRFPLEKLITCQCPRIDMANEWEYLYTSHVFSVKHLWRRWISIISGTLAHMEETHQTLLDLPLEQEQYEVDQDIFNLHIKVDLSEQPKPFKPSSLDLTEIRTCENSHTQRELRSILCLSQPGKTFIN